MDTADIEDTDIAVIGGGPAGSWAAYRLARAGARVAIFDPSHPREKPCGGGITGRAMALVAHSIDVRAIPQVRIRRARFLDGSREPVVVDLPDDALRVADRSSFDRLLFDAARAAGAMVVPARVTDITRGTHKTFRIRTAGGGREFTAARLIGADGANSLVRRRMMAPFRRDQLSMATGHFAAGVSSTEITLELNWQPAGYFWSFPRADHLAIGVCAQADAGATASALRACAAEWIGRTGIATGAGAVTPYAWPIPSLDADDLTGINAAGAGWRLVGDAAGLVDPITREGIFFALQSAELAAASLEGDERRGADDYNERVRSGIGRDLAHAARMKEAFFRPRFGRLLLAALRQSDAVRRVMVDLIAGQQPYADLRCRLLKTMELGLVWRLVKGF